MLLSSKKLLDEKIFKTSFPIKKGYTHFRRQTLPLFLHKELGPPKLFLTVLAENTALFFENT